MSSVIIGLAVLQVMINSSASVPVPYNQHFEEIDLANIPDDLNDIDKGSRFARFLNFRKYFHKTPENSFGKFENSNSIPSYHQGPHGYPFKHRSWHNHQPDEDCDYDSNGPWDPKNPGTEEDQVPPRIATVKTIITTESPATVTTTEVPRIDVRFEVGENEEQSKIYFPEDDE